MVGLLERMIAPRVRADSPLDDRYWGDGGGNAAAGINVTPETSLTYSAFYACVSVLGEDESTVPFPVFERRDDTRIPRPDHGVHQILNEQPNENQSAQEWREWMTAVCAMRGEALSEIVAGRRGFADQLKPLDPNATTKEKLPNGKVRYRVREEAGRTRYVLADDVFRLPGRLGLSVVTLAKETIGSAIAGDQFTGAMWRNGIKPRMALQHPQKLSEAAQKNLSASLNADHGGPKNAGKTLVFEEGMTWVKVGLDPKDAQFLESRQFSVEEVCRWFRMQPHKIAHLLRSTNNNIEHQGIEHVVDTMRPWCVRWEQAVGRQLIYEPNIYARHNLDALLRGDAVTSAQALEIERRNGIINANEWRALKERNPREDPGGEIYWDIQPGTGTGGSDPNGKKPSRARGLAIAAAGQVIRRETAAMSRKAVKYADASADSEAFEAWRAEVEGFYTDLRAFVAESLALSAEAAASYCDAKADEVLSEGVTAISRWEQRDINGLADLALGDSE